MYDNNHSKVGKEEMELQFYKVPILDVKWYTITCNKLKIDMTSHKSITKNI